MSLLGGSEAPADFAQTLASGPLAPVAKFAVVFPLSYHFLGAAPHIYWDKTAQGFTNAQMLQSSYALVGASTVIGLALAMYSMPAKDKKKN
jgi:succinate dehydrogenase (ubiquinone) cytochrome b560 subunit